MKPLGLNEIREKFLTFFEKKGHLRLKSFPLVPLNDKSLLVINSGMAPLKPYFTGQEIPPAPRVATCQKCIRTVDIDNVGHTMRHGTFFEMLGNFSFADYFKEEVIPWAWEFCTQVLELPEERLFPSVYFEDDEAYNIWRDKMNIPEHRIFRMGKEDNYWEVGLGPCGPCSEIYFDRGEKYGCGTSDCAVGCDCDRFMEIWNLVFTQFCKEEDGSYSKLKNTNIDTGMGLDRVAMVVQDVLSIFDIDTMLAVRNAVCAKTGVEYRHDVKKDVSIRIITDHARAVTFMAADGILPSNESRGYVLRRLLRRAVRHLKTLGVDEPYLAQISAVVVEQYGAAYPELREKAGYISKLITVEEQRFYETLDSGMNVLKEYVSAAEKSGKKELSGAEAFKLYDTYGFPVELLAEIVAEQGLTVDMDGFEDEMAKQKKRGREGREASTFMGTDETVYAQLDPAITTEFAGFNDIEIEATVLAVINIDGYVGVVLDKTVLYAESGGQKGDNGVIETSTGKILIKDCVKVAGNKIAHLGEVAEGTVEAGQKVVVSYDVERRMNTARNHSATHLLQRALKDVLGGHVEQSGSLVSGERLRFDFTHFEAVTTEQLKQVEDLVNEKIFEAIDIQTKEMPIDEAKKIGAVALFGEKYGDTARVVDIGAYSVELCGGTHVCNTAQIGVFKLLSESGIAAGVRRIEALTGKGALEYFKQNEARVKEIAAVLKTNPDDAVKRAETLTQTVRDLQKELKQAKAGGATDQISELIAKKTVYNGVTVIVSMVDDADVSALRELGDRLKASFNPGVFVLAGEKDGKASIIAMATDDAVKTGINCGTIMKEASAVAFGSGGGKPNMAQAGAKDPSKLPDALKKAEEIIKGGSK